MRKRLLLIAICALSVMMAMAQNRTNPDAADYFIKGYLSIERGPDGKPVYKLSNIQKQGINFDDPGSVMRGYETPDEDVLFQFSHYTTDYPGGIGTPLDFWRYDESINEWQPDVETRQGSAGVQEKKSMVLMLVLDCSSSLSNDFSVVQQAAKEFIKSLLDASNAGNIKIGIVGFSKVSETKFFPITRLTNDSYYQMCGFINSREVQNGTALYYAMDKAIDAMEEYCAVSIPSDEPLSSAMLVTFTDGLDQTSRDENKGIYTADDYYTELQRKMNNKRINGVPLQSKMRGVRGVDIATDAQLGKFSQIGNSLADFRLLSNMSELGQEFKSIAEGLINEWRVLNCYVPNSFKGRVAWTYPSRKPVVVERPQEPKEPREKGRFFFGINLGGGMSSFSGAKYYEYEYYNNYWDEYHWDIERQDIEDTYLTGSIGVDLAFPIGRVVNLGLFASVGYNGTYYDNFTFDGGPLVLINFKSAGSLYAGAGISYQTPFSASYYHPDLYGADFRLGYVFKNGLYLFGEFNFYSGYEYCGYEYYNGHIFSMSVDGNSFLFHIGYSF